MEQPQQWDGGASGDISDEENIKPDLKKTNKAHEKKGQEKEKKPRLAETWKLLKDLQTKKEESQSVPKQHLLPCVPRKK